MLHFVSSFVFPWLLVSWLGLGLALRARFVRRSAWQMVLLMTAAGVLVALPLHGVPVGRWLQLANYQASVPLTGLLAGQLWQLATQRVVFRPPERRTAWWFGLLAGVVLYPNALGWGHEDVYAWGWSRGPLLVCTAATVLLAAIGNRFSWLLIASLFAWGWQCLESSNLWDYLLDPVFALLGLCVVLSDFAKRWRFRRRAMAPPHQPPPGTSPEAPA